MPIKSVSRGRPKGSGLDDTPHLRQIAAKIAENPALKPTTAIKSIGISDPSTIRRLRDKYKKFAAQAEQTAPRTDSVQKLNSATMTKPVKLQTPRNEMRPAVSHREPRVQKRQPLAKAESLGEPASWMQVVFGLGVQAASTSLEIQTAAMRQFALFPPVAFAVQSQITLSELALKLYKNNKPLSVRAA